jgi:hypothetical protein
VKFAEQNSRFNLSQSEFAWEVPYEFLQRQRRVTDGKKFIAQIPQIAQKSRFSENKVEIFDILRISQIIWIPLLVTILKVQHIKNSATLAV